MGLARHKDDLSSEPSLRETLSDPVIQALMIRDGVSPDEIVRLILAARARLVPPAAHAAPLQEAMVLPFPVRPMPSRHGRRGVELEDPRPRTRWPFCVRASSTPETK